MKLSCTAAAALASCAMGSSAAGADCVRVLSHYYDPGTVTPSGVVCAPGGSGIHGSATFGTQAGDLWHGTTAYDYCLYPTSTPGTYTFSGIETLTGSVDGCGSGSFTWVGSGTFSEGSAGPGGGTWRIIPGSGTGRLRHARGSGTDTAFVSPALANYGEFDGNFAC